MFDRIISVDWSGDSEPRASTAQAIREALEAAGAEFIAENGGGPGVRTAKRKARQR